MEIGGLTDEEEMSVAFSPTPFVNRYTINK
jgi:hypothetical protein